MRKTILAATLALCLGGTSALAQSSAEPRVRNDSNVRWKFGAVCGTSSVSVVLDPNQSASIDPSFARQGCTLYGGSIKPGGDFNSGNMPGAFNATSVCGVNRAGSAYCTAGVVTLNIQLARVDKPVILLVDGNLFVPSAVPSAGGFNKPLLAGPHTVVVIGTGKGNFDISALWPLANGTMTSAPLLKGAAPNPMGGDTWMVSKTIQLDPMIP